MLREDLVRCLRATSCLTLLDLTGSHLGVKTFEVVLDDLSRHPVLELKLGTTLPGSEPDCDSRVARAVCDLLHSNSTLRHLDLSANSLSEAFAQQLAPVIATHPSLEELDLSKNHLDDIGASALASALHQNQVLRTLALNSCEVLDASPFAQLLLVNRRLECLDISFNPLGSYLPDLEPLGSAAASSPVLRVLSLRGAVSSLSSQRVATAGTLCQGALTELDLSQTPLGDAGACAVAKALKTNQTLVALKLASCRVGDAAAAALAEGLRENVTLKELDLGHNALGPRGAASLAWALCRNQSLKSVALEGSFERLGDLVGVTFFEVLCRNFSLTTLQVGGPLQPEIERLAEGNKHPQLMLQLRVQAEAASSDGQKRTSLHFLRLSGEEALSLSMDDGTTCGELQQLVEAQLRAPSRVRVLLPDGTCSDKGSWVMPLSKRLSES